MKKFNEFHKLNEEALPIQTGYYKVLNDFRISPGGGWRISFKKDQILELGRDDKLKKYIPVSGEWKNVSPPVEGHDTFNLMGFSDSKAMYYTFQQNTEKITPSEAEEITKGMAKEEVIKVRNFQRFVRRYGLRPNDNIKITL